MADRPTDRSGGGWFGRAATAIFVNIASAAILFIAALAFKPHVYDLLSPPSVEEYPLICRVEPRPGEGSRRWVEIYVINRTDEEQNPTKLRDRLRTFGPPDAPLSPAIPIEMKDFFDGGIAEIDTEPPFNENKGDIVSDRSADGRSATLRVRSIQPGAIMRVDIRFEQLRDSEVADRMTRNKIPFDYTRLHETCYDA